MKICALFKVNYLVFTNGASITKIIATDNWVSYY